MEIQLGVGLGWAGLGLCVLMVNHIRFLLSILWGLIVFGVVGVGIGIGVDGVGGGGVV